MLYWLLGLRTPVTLILVGRQSQVLPNILQLLPSCSVTSHQRSQLLRRPARIPSYGLILCWNWRFQVYTPHHLRHSWRLPATKIHLADEALMAIQDPLWIEYILPLAMMVDVGNTLICIPRHIEIVSLHYSNHLQVLCISITSLHSTWPTVRNQSPLQVNGIQVMGHCGLDITSAKAGMVGVKGSLFSSYQNNCCYAQVHRECPQNCHGTNQICLSTSCSLTSPSELPPDPPQWHRMSLLMNWF